MNNLLVPQIARELQLEGRQVEATVVLLDYGATVPFIARYRKENTAALDEVAISNIRDRLSQLRELGDRREAILSSLEKQGLLTEELGEAVRSAESLAALEDVYLPYRPKRRTRASIAREKGLSPLALYIWGQEDFDVVLVASEYVNSETEVKNVQDALSGRQGHNRRVGQRGRHSAAGNSGAVLGRGSLFGDGGFGKGRGGSQVPGLLPVAGTGFPVCLPTGHWPCSEGRRKGCLHCI